VVADIVRSLACFRSAAATNQLIKILHQQPEFIQFACLDSLRIQNRHEGVNFVINVSTGRQRDFGPEVRLKAGQIVAKIYGRRGIPLLLDGLYADNIRSVANALETLSLFSDKTLIPLLKEFSENENSRVATNAAIALFRFKSEREAAGRIIEAAAASSITANRVSALYAAGHLGHRRFAGLVIKSTGEIEKADHRIYPALIWAAIRLNVANRVEIPKAILRLSIESESLQKTFCYFFQKLTPADRQEFILSLASEGQPVLTPLDSILSRDPFAFEQERAMIRERLIESP
jgi:hypothetical protein